jgi:hypothetical protein
VVLGENRAAEVVGRSGIAGGKQVEKRNLLHSEESEMACGWGFRSEKMEGPNWSAGDALFCGRA